MQREGSHASIATTTASRRKSVSESAHAPAPAAMPAFNPVAVALKKLTMAGVLFIVVFFCVALWLFGSLYETADHTYKLSVAIVDFDGGPVGSALLSAVNAVNGQRTFPTFHVLAANSTSPNDVLRSVFEGQYWGSIVATEGASSRFEAAIASADAATSYDASQALQYSGLEVRYATAWSGVVLPALNKVMQSAELIFEREIVAPLLTSGTAYSSPSAQVLADPIGATFINQAPFTQGTRIVLNTIGFVLPFLFQFFFLMAMNGLFLGLGVYRGMSLGRHLKFRLVISLLWTLLTSLCSVAWGLMFDEDYSIEAKNFFASWTVHWVFSIIVFDTFDIVTTWVAPQFVSYIVVSVIILSVSSVIWPLELSNEFYAIHYAFPAPATWSILITILGRGCVNTLSRDAPVLMAWLIVLKAGVFMSLRRRAKQGVVLAQVEEKPVATGEGPEREVEVERLGV
ncbi:hypothetical protein DMC30DRAFT_445625 [Rhodotorula diobovata]|uniref:DUF3533 domain-containing protein n=1 Tax=Rhodotorula diobovata TaxID=5288 RepID=A0A5C5G0F1_9BASI|nr:hypothetical protein DMC30DRAFT_445625 [Rhodotorula diobovata]